MEGPRSTKVTSWPHQENISVQNTRQERNILCSRHIKGSTLMKWLAVTHLTFLPDRRVCGSVLNCWVQNVGHSVHPSLAVTHLSLILFCFWNVCHCDFVNWTLKTFRNIFKVIWHTLPPERQGSIWPNFGNKARDLKLKIKKQSCCGLCMKKK